MELNEIREKLNGIDGELSRLFLERMTLSAEVAAYKKERGLPILDHARERDILVRLTDGLDEEQAGYMQVLYNTIFGLSRSCQSRRMGFDSDLAERIGKALSNTAPIFPASAVVACQGTEGAYAQQACDKLFSRPSILYFSTFKGVFQAVEQNLCKYGILPIENSIYGSVNEVYDLMREHNFHIVRSLRLKIDHCLLVNPGTKLSDIKEVISHSQAIGQCAEFIKSLGEEVEVTMCANTAVAARLVAESGRTDIAAISSENCAELYGLSVLKNNIQNNAHNYTRFICISKEMEIYPGAGRVSIMFNLPHTPGSLYDFMSKIAAMGVNVLKLESRPIPGSDFEFMFYMDMEASVYAENVLSLLGELDSAPEPFVFLGSYSEI